MADYSSFPWNLWTKEEIARMMIDSKNVGDGDFVRACLGELARRRTPAPADGACPECNSPEFDTVVCEHCGFPHQ